MPLSNPPVSSPGGGTAGTAWRRAAGVLRLLWLVLLILPAASTTSATEPWDIDSRVLFGLSCWFIVAACAVLPPRWFFPLSLPVALAGVVCMGADFLRHVDLLDLALQWQTFTHAEVRSALRPYAVPMALAAVVLAAWCLACMRAPDQRRFVRVLVPAALVVTAALAVVVPKVAWMRVWPLDAALVTASVATNSQALLATLQPALSNVNPRSRAATWHARATSTAARQTMVFIIGESVRADFLKECGGPSGVRPVGAGAAVACDVTAGSDATHTSVPLLISREMPGHQVRVSTDATVLHALQEVGFETHWIGDQGDGLAWPDAQFQAYPTFTVSDEAALVPPLEKALQRPALRKAIALHAYNAHYSYCERFDPAQAPYPVDCRRLPADVDAADAATLRLAYADAVDASVGFVDAVIAELRRVPGEVFLVFTPDHGENLFDDRRRLFGHALRMPTRWDIRVPAIFWANDAWRAAHPAQWAALRARTADPLMHADMVPTFLAAAGVVADDARPLAVNLLGGRLPPRTRTIQRALGSVTDWETLEREAR
jgi:glucan phosphoethanolaminetransferase (alkaline phosphatase superfamily)